MAWCSSHMTTTLPRRCRTARCGWRTRRSAHSNAAPHPESHLSGRAVSSYFFAVDGKGTDGEETENQIRPEGLSRDHRWRPDEIQIPQGTDDLPAGRSV